MSLRRSSRTQAQARGTQRPAEGTTAQSVAMSKKKRARASTASEDLPTNGVAGEPTLSMPPPPATPQKRRKVTAKPPPLTPTPSAIALMTSTTPVATQYSTGDIDDVTPPPLDRRPAESHHTNAPLRTPGGTQLQPFSDAETQASPSSRPLTAAAPDPPANSSPATLLDEACAHLQRVDAALQPVIARFPCRIFSPAGLAEAIDPFRSLASGIMAQQVSGAAARSIKAKFVALFAPDAGLRAGFPPPARVAQTPLPTLRSAGLSQRKAEYIQGLAAKFVSGELSVRMLMEGSDAEVMERLVAVRGLGAWSVEMFMCFGLKRMDVFSTGDLGVQRGMAAHAGRDVKKLKAKGGNNKWKYMGEKEMLEIAEKFRPYRSLFMWYMWRVEDVDTVALEENSTMT